MKKLILSLVLAAMASPGALAQLPTTGNTATVGAQVNNLTGVHNRASNEVGIQQTAFARAPLSRGGYAPAPYGYEPVRTLTPSLAAAEPTLHAMFGPGPLVNNNVSVGAQINMINGSNNSAANALAVGQTAGAGGMAGGLVNNNVSVGAQVNMINGSGNQAFNGIDIGQGGFAGRALPLS